MGDQEPLGASACLLQGPGRGAPGGRGSLSRRPRERPAPPRPRLHAPPAVATRPPGSNHFIPFPLGWGRAPPPAPPPPRHLPRASAPPSSASPRLPSPPLPLPGAPPAPRAAPAPLHLITRLSRLLSCS